MKLRVAIGTALWLLVISVAHVHLNIGWARAGSFFKGLVWQQQKQLQVGFLPVT